MLLPATLGTGDENAVRIDDPTLERVAAVLELCGGRLTLTDLGARSTSVGGAPIAPLSPHALDEEFRFELGGCVVEGRLLRGGEGFGSSRVASFESRRACE